MNALARRIGVNPSSASRLLATLERGGLVAREPGGPYRLGLHLVALADRVLASLDVRELARPYLRSLAEATGETVSLSVPDGEQAVTVDFVPGASTVVSMAHLGRPSVGHATSTGKVLLAHAAPAGLPDVLPAFTERTITDPAALEDELERVRAQGWAESVGEREPDLNALAAPVFGRGGAAGGDPQRAGAGGADGRVAPRRGAAAAPRCGRLALARAGRMIPGRRRIGG